MATTLDVNIQMRFILDLGIIFQSKTSLNLLQKDIPIAFFPIFEFAHIQLKAFTKLKSTFEGGIGPQMKVIILHVFTESWQ